MTLSEELNENLPSLTDDDVSENGTVGDPYIYHTLEKYFEDKPERGYEKIGNSEEYNGRHAWPPFTEIFLFKVDGQLYAVDGESDSWEGGWPIYDRESIRAVEEVQEQITVKKYKTVEEK